MPPSSKRKTGKQPRVLRGADPRTGTPVRVVLGRESHRERNLRAQTGVPMLLGIAADPDLHQLAAWIDQRTSRDQSRGGRPRSHPTWSLLVFGAGISVFGSASATARHLQDPLLWRLVVDTASQAGTSGGSGVPGFGPSRDQWFYFMHHRISPEILVELSAVMRNLAARLAHDIGLLDPDTRSMSRLDRAHLVGVDGKVFSSPQRHDPTQPSKADKTRRRKRKVRTPRLDSARQLYGEGGQDAMAWGSKFAIASVRSRLSGHRVILGISHIPHTGAGGEGSVFADLMLDLAGRQPGIAGFVADGALRGTHIGAVQSRTGCAVVSPPRRRSKQHGGIMIGNHGHAAAPLPPSRTRTAWLTSCGGHALFAAGGGLFERVITADGSVHYNPITRHQTKRTRLADGTFAFYARHSFQCALTGKVHDWWEPITPTKTDQLNGFNRADYLRYLPASDREYGRIYLMRNDTESLNAQLERAFHNHRLPAWGLHNQTLIVLMTVLAQNAWARLAWQRAIDRQTAPPSQAA